MLDRFLEFIKKHALIEEGDKLLLAVSGGVDSMTLLDLFSEASYPFAVAHCNFQLRGKDSDLDEKLVKSTCEELKVTFHKIRFDTKRYAKEHGVSTQMAAREMRFSWFETLCNDFGYNKIVLAHHLDDSIETFFLNLARGTSLKGLRGIQPKNDKLIRPMLEFSKDEILHFAKNEGLRWREDASNEETYYKRNLIRHELIPVLEKINPEFQKVMSENLEKLNYRYETSENLYREIFQSIVVETSNGYQLNKNKVLEKCRSPYDLYELLRTFGFNYATSRDLFEAIKNQAIGKLFKAEEFELLIDRDQLLITNYSNRKESFQKLTVHQNDSEMQIEDQLYTLRLEEKDHWKMDRDPFNGSFDADKLTFPLTVRAWQQGDSFKPLGMKGNKLVSDLLIDLKVPLTSKGSVKVLISDHKIVWVIGHRISEEFKVSDRTRKVWSAQLK